ncbi:MAG: hypothetical protein ACI85I_000052 [Arenicella sp.]|jgi:hypothetical protein
MSNLIRQITNSVIHKSHELIQPFFLHSYNKCEGELHAEIDFQKDCFSSSFVQPFGGSY